MMSLLNVTVKRGKISAASGDQQKPNSEQQHNTFLVLKLENVKSQTLPLKGVDPAWDEEFLFETNKTAGVDLLVELWQKGLIWDNVIGYKLIQVDQLFQGQIAAQFNGYGATAPSKFHATRWFSLDADLLVAGGLDQPAIIGTKNPTPYQVLLDLRWELTGFVGGGGGGVIADPTGAGVGMGMGMGMMMDQGGGGGMHSRPFVEHSSVENYNKIDSYGSIIGYGSVAYEDMTDDYSRQPYDQPQHQQQHPYNNSEMYSSTSAYNNGLDEDALYNRLPPDNNGYDDDNRSYLMGNSYGDGGDGTRSRESTFQDNNYSSYYDNSNTTATAAASYPNQLQQPSSCDMTKRPKLLPQVPMATPQTYSSSPAYINDPVAAAALDQQQLVPGSGFSFDVYGGTATALTSATDPYRTSDCAVVPPYNNLDNEYDYECDVAAVRPARTRRKVLPSAPKQLPSVAGAAPYGGGGSSSLSQYNDEFENEPLSYNSQPPGKLMDDHRSYCSGGAGDMYDYELEMDTLMGVINHVDQLNWKNSSQAMNSYDDLGGGEFTPPPPRLSSKRKVLPQVPVHQQQQSSSKYGAAKSLPATPATSALGINGKSRKLPFPAGANGQVGGIPTSTTITGFTNDYDLYNNTQTDDYNNMQSYNSHSHHHHRPQYTSSLSADAGDEYAAIYQQQSQLPYEDMHSTYHPHSHHHQDTSSSMAAAKSNSTVTPTTGTATTKPLGGIGLGSVGIGKPSLFSDMKSLLSKTSSSILPAMSSTLNNVSSSLSASIPPVGGVGGSAGIGGGVAGSNAHVQPKCPPVSTLANETDMSYDFMKSNKFEEAKGATSNHSSSMMMMMHQDINSTYYDDTENQLNNNFNMGDLQQDQSMYGGGGGYDSYDQQHNMGGYYDEMSTTSASAMPKLLPSVPVPYVTTTSAGTSSSTSQARNFFQSKNNTTFHSTVENVSEEDPLSSSAALNPSNNNMKMSTNNSYELEDMSVDKSLYGSSFHTDIDEYDLIANGDIKQNFTYTEKNLLATGGAAAAGGAGAGAGDINGSGPLKTDAKSKLSHNSFMDNDAVNNNSANQRTVYGTTNKSTSNPNDYVDEYSFNEGTATGGAGGMYGHRPSELDEYGAYDQQQHNDHYYGDHHQQGDEDQYYDGYGGGGRKVPVSVGQDGNAQEYYYNQVVELGAGGVVVGSNLEGIEELDEYERDEKDVEDEEHPYDSYNYYNTPTSTAGGVYKKDSLKNRDHEFIEEEEEEPQDDEERDRLQRENSEEYLEDEEGDSKDDSKHWNDDYRHHASDDEIIDTEAKKTATATTTITTTSALHSEAGPATMPMGPSPLSGISALMSSMAPSAATQSSLSPGSMLAAGITTTLAANISNTITTTITGSPSIIFDPTGGEGELGGTGGAGGGTSTISKTMGALGAGDGAVKPTAKQRWHHAYNKIIMQLNVSTGINQ